MVEISAKIRPSLIALNVGDEISFPIEKLKMCLNACNKINRMPIIEIFKGAAPYVICNVIVLISISLWGPLTTALPQLLGYSIF